VERYDEAVSGHPSIGLLATFPPQTLPSSIFPSHHGQRYS
jgi:hypothetical protein